MAKSLWIVITNDEYELPVMVADTPKELAKMYNTTEDNIRSCVSKFERGILKWTRFRRIKYE